MKESVASNLRTLVLTIALAMVACVVGLFPNSAWAQVPDQAAACDFRSQPLPITLSPGQRGRVSIGRIVEILAEDLTPAQTAQALVPSQFVFPRLVTRAPTSYNVSTVAALVAAIYIGGDQAVSANLVRQITALIKRLGPNRVSLEEVWRSCNQLNVTTGLVEQVRSTGGLCADGTLAVQGTRSRTLLPSFDGDFYSGSSPQWVGGRTPVDHHGWYGHSLRVNLKGFDRTTPFSFSIPRVYGADNYPRPGAQLCKRLPELAIAARNATDSAAQRAIFGEQGNLIDAAAAEGDMLAVRWANAFTNGTVNPTVARTDATAGCEQREVFLNGTIAHQGRVIEDLNNKMVARNVTINGWRNVATVGYALFILAVILLITFVVRKRREMLMFIENWEKRVASTAAQAKEEFWLGLEPGLRQMINALRGNLPAGESFAWVESLAGAPSVASATAGDPSGFFRHARTAFAVAVATKPAAAPTEGSVQPQVGEAKPPRLPPPSTTPISYVDDDGVGMEIKAQADFDAAAKAIDAAAFQRGVSSVVILSTSVCPAILAFCDSKSDLPSPIICPSRELLSYATISSLAADLEGAEKDLQGVLGYLAQHEVIDAQLVELPFDVAAPAIGHQIKCFATSVAIAAANTEALARSQAAESTSVFCRSVAEAVYEEVFSHALPEGQVPTSTAIARILRALKGRRAETGPTAAITIDPDPSSDAEPTDSLDASLSLRVITNDPGECMELVGRQLTVQTQVPECVRQASMTHRRLTIMVAAAAQPNLNPTKVFAAAKERPATDFVALAEKNGGDGTVPVASKPAVLSPESVGPVTSADLRLARIEAPSRALTVVALSGEPITNFTPNQITPFARLRKPSPASGVQLRPVDERRDSAVPADPSADASNITG